MSYYMNSILGSSPSTLNSAIQKFLTDLELTDRQATLVADRQKTVRERATKESLMDVETSLLIGSYARNTQIRPIPSDSSSLDVDALLVLESSDWNLKKYWHVNDGGASALNDLLKALQSYQGLKTVKIDRPSVTITWQEMIMELTPAFRAKGGGFLIPSKNMWGTKWIHTAPDLDADELTKANKTCNQELKPMVKMLKSWNRNYGRQFGGFAIETQAYHSTKYSYNGLGSELLYFFQKLLENDGKTLTPPSGIGEILSIQLSSQQRQLINNIKFLIDKAINEASRGNHSEAIRLMGIAFGKPFTGVI